MISLFLNTASKYLSVALIKNDEVLDEIYLELNKDLSRVALVKTKELMEKNSVAPSSVDEIICVRGPGSFTGLRVGVTISKVYAHFLNKKLFSVSHLYVMATSVSSDVIVPLIDARRGYVYAGIYDRDYNVILEEKYIKLEELEKVVSDLSGEVIYVSNDEFSSIEVTKYKLNTDNLVKHMKKKEEDPIVFIPNYLKRPEAEENRDND